MRFLVLAAVVAAAISFSSDLMASTPAPGADSSGGVALSASGGGRAIAGTGRVESNAFGKWWKKLKRILARIISFIDGIIEDVSDQPGDNQGKNLIGGPGGFVERISPDPTPVPLRV